MTSQSDGIPVYHWWNVFIIFDRAQNATAIFLTIVRGGVLWVAFVRGAVLCVVQCCALWGVVRGRVLWVVDCWGWWSVVGVGVLIIIECSSWWSVVHDGCCTYRTLILSNTCFVLQRLVHQRNMWKNYEVVSYCTNKFIKYHFWWKLKIDC